MGSTTNNSKKKKRKKRETKEKRDKREKRKKKKKKGRGKEGKRFQNDFVVSLCVYSSTVLPASPLPLVTVH